MYAELALSLTTSLAYAQAPGSLNLTTFGLGNGKVITPVISNADNNAHAMTIQSGGKIRVAGSGTLSNDQAFCVVRYNVDSTLDTMFSIEQYLRRVLEAPSLE
jgi:Domain of unknown function (DUF5122) beta-propeller